MYLQIQKHKHKPKYTKNTKNKKEMHNNTQMYHH